MPRRRNLRNYSVHELSLVLEPDIGRRAAIIKSKQKDPASKRVNVVDEIIARINKSRLPPMDQMGNPIDDPNALSPAAVKAIQALGRQLALHRDELTIEDLVEIGQKVGLAPGANAEGATAPGSDGQSPISQPGSDSASDGGESGLTADGDIGDDENEFPEQQPPSDEEDQGAQVDGGDDFDDDNNELLADEDESSDYDRAAEPEDDDDYDDESAFDNDDVDPEDEPEDADMATSQSLANDAQAHANMNWNTPPPAGVSAQDHQTAVTNAKGSYLSSLKKKGYNLSKGNSAAPTPGKAAPPAPKPTTDKQQPKIPPSSKGKGKNPMGNDIQQMVRKSISQMDWSKFTPEQREQLEPIKKSLGAAFQENTRLSEANAELVQKHNALYDEVAKMRADNERKELVIKTAQLTHLTGHDGLVDAALAIPAGDARDKFMETLKAQNAQIEEIKKSRGGAGDITDEAGTRNGGEPIVNSGESPETKWNRMVAERVTKSAEQGKAIKDFQAADLILKTAEGKEAYAKYNDWLMRRH